MTRLFGNAIVGALLIVSGLCAASELIVTVKNIKSPQGKIIARLYAGSEQWLRTEFKVESQVAKMSETSLVFKKIPPGEYAIAVFQDLDGDGKMATNFMASLPIRTDFQMMPRE